MIKLIFLSIAIFQGLVIGFILLYSPFFKNKTNRYLAFAILSLCWSLLNLVLDITQIFEKYSFLKIIDVLDSAVLYPLLILLYIRHQVNHPKKNSKQIIWLFAPFILSIGYSILEEINSELNALYKTSFLNGVALLIEISVLLITIFFLPFILWKTYQSIQFTKNKLEKRWLMILWISEATMLLSWLGAALVGVFFDIDISSAMHFIAMFSTLAISWIAYTGLYKFKLANERLKIQKLLVDRNPINTAKPQLITEPKITTKSVSEESESKDWTKSDFYFEELERLCNDQKIYRDSTLDRNKIAEMLGISTSYVSQIVSSKTGGNLTTYINQYRIEEVKRMIEDEDFKRYSLLAIGLECGFASKSPFYNAFKKLTGMTPNTYKNAIDKF